MTSPASLPDDELVRQVRGGRRDAFAVLYHRYVRQVHARVVPASPDAAAAEATTVAVFGDLMRHIGEVEGGRVAQALEQHATRRTRGHVGGVGIRPLTVGGLDRMWRELDRRWPSGDPPRRDVGTMVPVTAGALVAILVLGALASSSRRGGVPDPDRSFEAVALRDDVPGLMPALPRPSPAATAATPEPEMTVVMPSETATAVPSANPTETATASEAPEPEPTEARDTAPTVAIRAPADGSTHRADGEDDGGAFATVTVDGLASDDRDPVEALAYRWTSDLEGGLAESPTATVRLHIPDGQLTASHTLTFSATDSAGNLSSASVTVLVTRV